ncbi:MAG: alpha/beta fold hydrolase [Cyanobacteriota bacterium]
MVSSVLLLGVLTLAPLPPARAAEQLMLQGIGLKLPIDLSQLRAWSRGAEAGELGLWLSLLSPEDQKQLRQLLQRPLLRQRSFAQQLLNSWVGMQVVQEIGDLVTTDDGRSTHAELSTTLNHLLADQRQVTALDLLQAMPSPRLTLQVDRLAEIVGRWRLQLQRQGRALTVLDRLPLVLRERRSPSFDQPGFRDADLKPQTVNLAVPHRPGQRLHLRIWSSPGHPSRTWVLLMPGLGGNGRQLAWLATSLAEQGWPVLAIDHPGSDDAALQALVDGVGPAPGPETLVARLQDLEAVLTAERDGRLPHLGDSVVLVGHSLGGLTALLGVGLRPEAGLSRRCQSAVDGLPLINLSRFLQCQLLPVSPPAIRLPVPVAAVVSFNSFGSLLWPRHGLQPLALPVLMVGGSQDLVTPPLAEQLDLFLPHQQPLSRLVLVRGGSHFSVVRLPRQDRATFQLDTTLVGVEPLRVQALLAGLTADFLRSLRQPSGLPVQRRLQDGVEAFVLDRPSALRWQEGLAPPKR